MSLEEILNRTHPRVSQTTRIVKAMIILMIVALGATSIGLWWNYMTLGAIASMPIFHTVALGGAWPVLTLLLVWITISATIRW